MTNTCGFWVYRLNIDAKVNQCYDEDYDDGYEHHVTAGGGNCFFDDQTHLVDATANSPSHIFEEKVCVWRQTDDWYCSIYSGDPEREEKLNEVLRDAYDMLYDPVSIPAEERTYEPILLFYNEDIW